MVSIIYIAIHVHKM